MAIRPPNWRELEDRLDPNHLELVELLRRLYDKQQRARPRSLEEIARDPKLLGSVSQVSEALSGNGRKPPPPVFAGKLAHALGGDPRDCEKAERLANEIPPVVRYRWVLAGDQVRDHVAARASGHLNIDWRGGDLFAGRTRAIDRVTNWLRSHEVPGVPLVVTGQPGAGKSSVVARAARDLESAKFGFGVFFHARSASHVDLLDAIRQVTEDKSIADTTTLMEHLHRRTTRQYPRLLVVVDALDEAASRSEQAQIGQILQAVAAQEAVRVVVATRPGRDRDLLQEIGVQRPDASQLVDLDTDAYFDVRDVQQVTEVHLTQRGARAPGPASHAWTLYGKDPALTQRLARVIARRADRNFLVAVFAAHSLSTEPEAIDPAARDFDDRHIPSSVSEAFDKYFKRLKGKRLTRTRYLLTALAYARGPGLDEETWLQITAALGVTATLEDLRQLRDTPVVDFLLETRSDGPSQPSVTRLYHQALADQLLQHAMSDGDQRILHQLIPPNPDDWSAVSPYVSRHLIDHAAAASELLTLLRQPQYLAVADLPRVLANLPANPTGELRVIASILRTCAHRASECNQRERTSLFAVTSAHLGHFKWRESFNQRTTQLGGPTVMWAHAISNRTHQILISDEVSLVAVGWDVIVTVDIYDGIVRIWDADGRPIGEPLTGHTSTFRKAVNAVVVGRLGGRDVIITGAEDGTVRIWDTDGDPVGEPLTGHNGSVATVAVGQFDGRDVIITGAEDGTVRIWDADGRPVGEPLTGHNGSGATVAVGQFDGRDVIITGAEDGTVRIWDTDGRAVGEPLTGHNGPITTVAVGQLDGRDVIITSSDGYGDDADDGDGDFGSFVDSFNGSVRIWDTDGRPVGELLTGHNGPITTVAVGQFDGRDVIVTGGFDGTVRIWNADGQPIGEPLTGHALPVIRVAVGQIRGRDVIVTSGFDGTVRIWDTDGDPVGEPLTGHNGPVTTVAVGQLDGRDVIVTGGDDRNVQIWDANGHQIRKPLAIDYRGVVAIAVCQVGGRDVVVTADRRNNSPQIWDSTGHPLGEPSTKRYPKVAAMAVGRFDGRDVIVTGNSDGSAQVWDAAVNPIGQPLTGHTGEVRALTIGRLVSRDVVITGGEDRTVRVWDSHSREIVALPTLQSVTAVATNGSVVYAGVGSALVAWRFS